MNALLQNLGKRPRRALEVGSTVALVLGTLLAGLLPVGIASNALLEKDALKSDDLGETARPAVVYYAIRRVLNTPSIARLDGTPVEVDYEGLKPTVESVVSEEDAREVVLESHRRLVERVKQGSQERIVVVITALRNDVLDALNRHLRYKLSQLPDCDTGEDVSAIWTGISGFLTGEAGIQTLEQMPRCIPPGPLRSEIESGLTQRIQGRKRTAGVELLREGETTLYLQALGWTSRYLQGGWWLLWIGLVLACFALFAGIRLGLGRPLARSLGIGFGVLGLAWGIGALGFALVGWLSELIARSLIPRPALASILDAVLEPVSWAIAWRLSLVTLPPLALASASLWIAARRRPRKQHRNQDPSRRVATHGMTSR